MTRVLNILTDTNIGGAGRCLVNYLKYCDRSAFSVEVVLPKNSALKEELLRLEVPVLEAEGIGEKSFSPAAIGTLKKIIRAEKPDIVHTHGSLSGRIAARRCGTKIVYTRHSAFPVPPYLKKGPGHWLGGFLARRYADAVIAVSPAARENLVDSGVPEEKITVMMNGVEPLARSPKKDCQALRQRLGIPEGVFTGGILARLEPYKGILLLLDAAEELKAEGREFRLLIGGSGPEEETLRARIREKGLEDQVLMLGFVRNVAEVLSILDVQINCSWVTETSSLSIIEGMSLGVPAVVSNCSGNPWLVEDGASGLLFENRNSHDLAIKLTRLMDDFELLEMLRQNAKAAYEAKFTGQIFAGNIEEVYRKTMDRKGDTNE